MYLGGAQGFSKKNSSVLNMGNQQNQEVDDDEVFRNISNMNNGINLYINDQKPEMRNKLYDFVGKVAFYCFKHKPYLIRTSYNNYINSIGRDNQTILARYKKTMRKDSEFMEHVEKIRDEIVKIFGPIVCIENNTRIKILRVSTNIFQSLAYLIDYFIFDELYDCSKREIA